MREFVTLSEAGLPMADAILREAFHNPAGYLDRLRRLIELEPTGYCLLTESGRALATGGCVIQGKTAYVGLVGVLESAQGRGHGRALMDEVLRRARTLGAIRILLDASPAGRPLYESMGFVADDRCDLYTRKEQGAAPPILPRTVPGTEGAVFDGFGLKGSGRDRLGPPPPVIHAFDPGSLAEVLAFDAEHWGDDRSRSLIAYLGDWGTTALVARAPHGVVAGYGILQRGAGVLGPLLATDSRVAATLMDGLAVRAENSALVAFAPAANPWAGPLLEARGFTLLRSVTHMRQGPTLPREDRRRSIFSQFNLALG